MMTVPMDNSLSPSSRELAKRLYKKNIELENGLRKSAQSKVPSDPNIWLQMRENYEAIILEDHDFSEKHEVEYALWQLHYRRIEEFRTHINAAASAGSNAGKSLARPDRIKRIRSVFKTFLSEATGFYHDLILKISSKYGLPFGYFSEGPENRYIPMKDEKKSAEMKKGLMSCHRCLIYLGDLARYKGLYGEGDSVSRDYAAAFSYYMQAASLCPSSGNPHHQLAILASYSGDDLVAVYRYFRSLAVDNAFPTARDNLVIAFEKNRQSYSQLPGAKIPSSRALPLQSAGRGRGRADTSLLAKDTKTESVPTEEREFSTSEIFRAFSTRFVRLNGILFTRTSLETFGEIFSSMICNLHDLLSSGPEEELSFGPDAAANALVIVRLIAILIFTVHNVNRDSEGQSYAEILQRTVLLQNAFTAAFEFAGYIVKRCTQLHDAPSSYLLPAILVFIEWLASHPDIAAGFDVEEKQASARSFFWNQCVSFMNKLILTGLVSIDGDEDETCFSDMSRYDEGETGNRLALWEDFELRGFLPLVPAQLILDFSRKHALGSDGSTKEKRARVQRILAAGRALMNVVQVNHQRIYFDTYQKKFVLSTEPPASENVVHVDYSKAPESNITKQGSQVKCTIDLGVEQLSTVNLGVRQPKALPYGEGGGGGEEEEEEEIVFKPMVADKYPDATSSRSTAHEPIQQPVQISSVNDWSMYVSKFSAPLDVQVSTLLDASSHMHPVASNVSQLPLQSINLDTSKWLMGREAFLSDRLKNFNITEGGFLAKQKLQEGPNSLQPTAFSPLFSAPPNLNTLNMLASQMKPAEVAIPSKLDSIVPSGATSDGLAMNPSAALPTKKNPVSRPARHYGPPPGFSHLPSKQQEDVISNSVIKDQHLQIDDYSWLDGHQSSSIKSMEVENSVNHMMSTFPNVSSANSDAFAIATSFPFPGKQISSMQTPVLNEKKWQDFQLFEHSKSFSEEQRQQANPQNSQMPHQHQAQSLWSGRYFV
ncbi:nonsense-mediated mRNA decay factor SMG7 [Elaeis guineensis]|uniref:Protein SMG7 n=1 Tax=Elaeis guineensis var. tenera TaxID=51953 RepID=A0A6I9RKJ8_ELAGV|nr:protein SMG7 [Elaeis guineensis]XP_010928323.1 protein SMG7 [Elaeis guineensis]